MSDQMHSLREVQVKAATTTQLLFLQANRWTSEILLAVTTVSDTIHYFALSQAVLADIARKAAGFADSQNGRSTG